MEKNSNGILWVTHSQDTTEATRSHLWLFHTAAIQTRIAEDVWWFSNLCSCHREMGLADPCHPHSESQTAPHLHLNLPPPPRYLRPPLRRPPALRMSGPTLHGHIPARPPGSVGLTHCAATRYNVTLPPGKGSTPTCSEECCTANVTEKYEDCLEGLQAASIKKMRFLKRSCVVYIKQIRLSSYECSFEFWFNKTDERGADRGVGHQP